jgi:hypothetical protein
MLWMTLQGIKSSATKELNRSSTQWMNSVVLKTHMQFTKKWMKSVIRLLIPMIEKLAMQRSERH